MFEAVVLMGILLSGRIFKINYLYTTGVLYTGFFKGGGWFLAVAESMWHVPEMLQLVNCNLIKSCFTRNLRQCQKVKIIRYLSKEFIHVYLYHNIVTHSTPSP